MAIMVHDERLMVHGEWFMINGSRLMVQGEWFRAILVHD